MSSVDRPGSTHPPFAASNDDGRADTRRDTHTSGTVDGRARVVARTRGAARYARGTGAPHAHSTSRATGITLNLTLNLAL